MTTAGSAHQVEACRWIDTHLRWGEEIIERFESRDLWPRGTSGVEPGKMAVAMREPTKRLRLLSCTEGRKARLVDVGEPDRKVVFSLETVVFADLPAFT
jgi:hypothetical protein